MKPQYPLIVFLTLSMSTGLAEEADTGADEGREADKVCVNKRNISSFDTIDDQYLYIRASGNRHFLFTMWGRCYGLRDAHGIGITDTMSRVCSGGFGEVVYRDMSRRFQTCRIDTIETVASREDAKGLVEERKRAKEEKKSDE